LLYATYQYPLAAGAIAGLLLATAIGLLLIARRMFKRVFGKSGQTNLD
jgi:nitrate reductase gamma subunit